MDLFASLRGVQNFDGNPYDKLSVVVMPDHDEYNLAEMPTSIGLHGVHYTIVFRPGNCAGFCVALTM